MNADGHEWINVGTDKAICHLDIDVHLIDANIELFIVDRFTDTSCYDRPDRFQTRLIAKVECYNLASTFSHSPCEKKVYRKIKSLNASDYYAAFTEADTDQCPTPRL